MSIVTITAQLKEPHLEERLTTPFNQSHLVYLVSMGKRKSGVTESHHLEATIDLIDRMQAKEVSVVIAGKLQRLSFWNSNLYPNWSRLSEVQLKNTLENFASILTNEATKRGEEWKTNNQAIVNNITSCKPRFLSWDDVLNLENYKKYQTIIQELYQQDKGYKDVLESSADTYVSFHRKDIKNVEHHNLAKQLCIKYLLEESPLIIPSVLGADYILYHAEPNMAMVEIYKRLYPTRSLAWFPIHYTFESQKYFKSYHSRKTVGVSKLFYSKRQEKRNKALVA